MLDWNQEYFITSQLVAAVETCVIPLSPVVVVDYIVVVELAAVGIIVVADSVGNAFVDSVVVVIEIAAVVVIVVAAEVVIVVAAVVADVLWRFATEVKTMSFLGPTTHQFYIFTLHSS